MQEDRLKKALSKALETKAMLTEMWARKWHLREDYPGTDNENWLKWIIIQNKNEEMVISTENVPIERYPVRP
jgi:succinate dehydrogenase/fumarate reductase flavoprotein subunit